MSFHSYPGESKLNHSEKSIIPHCFPELGNGPGLKIKSLNSDRHIFQPINFGAPEKPVEKPAVQSAPPPPPPPPEKDAATLAAEQAKIESDIQQRAQETEKQAYQEGFGQGQRQGLESGIKQLEPVLQNFRQALQELDKLRAEIYRKAESETVDLALAIARKVICREIATDKKVVLNVIKEALAQSAGREAIKIKINPTDLELIKTSDIELSSYFAVDDSIRFEADQSISSGGCVIETDLGEIDARIEKQLQIVEAAFRQELLDSVMASA